MEENNYIIMCYDYSMNNDGAFRGFLAIDGRIVPNVYNSTFYTKPMAFMASSNANAKYPQIVFRPTEYKKFSNKTNE